MRESLVTKLLSRQWSFTCALVPAQTLLHGVCIWSSFSFNLNVTFSESLSWLSIRLVLYYYCCHPPALSECLYLSCSIKLPEDRNPVCWAVFPTNERGALSNSHSRWLSESTCLWLSYAFLSFSLLSFRRFLCPCHQLGGLGLILCVGVRDFFCPN